MEKIPTAEEFLRKKYNNDFNSFSDNVESIIEFAKLHVEAALKAAQMNAEITEEPFTRLGQTRYKSVVDYDSILNSYPPENIK